MPLHSFATGVKKSILPRAIRHGLTLAIPFLILGSFCLLILNFPNEAYQNFIRPLFGGALVTVLTTVYSVTLGSLAMVLAVTISLSYGIQVETDNFLLYPLVAVCSYLAFCGGLENNEAYIFNAEWVFTAMCITLLSCIFFRWILAFVSRFERLHTSGAEYLFNVAIQSFLPTVLIIFFFAVAGFLLRAASGSSNVTNFGSFLFLKLFDGMSGNLFGILLYVVLSHLLWFFGIHGTNTLEAVSRRLFEHNIEINQGLLAAGSAPTEIFSKTFLDTFVFLGGCGCALSFAVALCIASRKSHHRKIALVALPSVLFNISEIVVFGFPIIFNFTMMIPFILTPIVLMLTSTLATMLGLVPYVTQSVEWTVPIVLSGYQATGSIAGSILQIVNMTIGVLIYIPFIRKSEKRETESFRQAVQQMGRDMENGESTDNIPVFLSRSYPYSFYAKTLAMDLRSAIARGQIELFYQPQTDAEGRLHGLEALLRWNHPVAGYISPPVIIGIANEKGLMDKLSFYLLRKACDDASVIQGELQKDIQLSFNLSPKQIEAEHFFERALSLIQEYEFTKIHFVLEITERSAMKMSDSITEDMERLKNAGITFSLDDFGMGHNSILRLQEGVFSEVKLDGKLVSQIQNNDRSKEIIASIIRMAENLGLSIIAEFVETEEQRDALLSLGCTLYQGYHYSRPLALGPLLEYIKRT